MSDSLREKITEYAREDAAQNVYMGKKFVAMRKSEVAKVAPNRFALMGKLNQDMANMKEIREADERWLCILFGKPYEAEFQSEGTGSAIVLPQLIELWGLNVKMDVEAKKLRPIERKMTTPLFLP